ncbi:MAG: indole-3-glycerol phosphate synthase TrpC [Phycisphaerales bacterium]|jgi:indole-3-glycerol phosphate synthase|nr:indole-3-glycerol phosphate synthase TrpC [Phycisphaerales bacterium]
MDFLSTIVRDKREDVAAAQSRIPLDEMIARARDRGSVRDFNAAMAREEVNIISEIKRASPSKGPIRLDLDPVELATAYAEGGAAAISVLTEERYFLGSLADLQAARSACALPVLRKDFTLTDYQVYESAASGADALLLIVRLLERNQLDDLLGLTHDLGLEALVELYDEADLETIEGLAPAVIGINNRDLKTFQTDLAISKRIAAQLDERHIPVAASGIFTRADVEGNLDLGIRGFLIGESLVRSDNPAAMLRELRGVQ